MLFEFFVSLFGCVIIHRNVSLVEKAEMISASKLMFIFGFLLIPFGLYLFFKELLTAVLIYIGIFSITLILHDKIIAYFAQKTFEKMHFNIIERLILQMNTGKSSSTSIKILFSELTEWEKHVFSGLHSLLDEEKSHLRASVGIKNQFYFTELRIILQSSSHVGEQLRSFREALRLQNNLRHRSRQVLQQCRAQALVCVCIYAVLLIISVRFLSLQIFSEVTAVSFLLFSVGMILIYRLGGKIRWKT